MHLSTPKRNIHIKISGPPAYSERKVVDKRLGNFVVVFIYLKERNFGKKTLCGN